jgi:hypothetical protein
MMNPAGSAYRHQRCLEQAMSDPQSLNIYSPADLAILPAGERVFISHRRTDKPLAEAVAAVLGAQGVHYWFDKDDEDTQRAVDLGMAGDQALVHSIERGIKHCSQMLGLLSAATRGSWWVPYEIGFSRSQQAHTSYLVLESIRRMDDLPEYARLAANYWSVDELVRWAASLAAGHVQAVAAPLDGSLVATLEQFVPLQPREPAISQLSARALAAIEQLSDVRTQEALRLTSAGKFQWLPTTGGLVRDLAYDLYAPLAFYQLHSATLTGPQKDMLDWIYQSVTLHYDLAQVTPRIAYQPEAPGWRQRRYVEPASSWLQGLSPEQLEKRLRRFFIVPDMSQNLRLATKEEFKAEFDRVLRPGTEHDQRSLGVLVNPLFGFTPRDRPVFRRVLALQHLLHIQLAGRSAGAIFEDSLIDEIQRFVWNRKAGGTLRPVPLRASHNGAVNAVAAAELDGRPVVISGSADGTVRIWDLATGAPVGTPFTRLGDTVVAVAAAELDGRPVVISGGGIVVRVSDLATGAPVGTAFTEYDNVWAVAGAELGGRPVVIRGGEGPQPVGPDALRLISGGEGPKVRGREAPKLTSGGKGPMDRFNEALELLSLFSGGGVISPFDGTVRVSDLATGTPVGDPFTGHRARVVAVAAAELERRPVVISGSADKTVRVWDLATGAPVGDPFTGHSDTVYAVAAAELDGRPVVISGSADGTVRVWDLATGAPTGSPFTGHTGPVNAVAAAELDGRPVVISGSADKTVRAWNLATGAPTGGPFTSQPNAVTS